MKGIHAGVQDLVAVGYVARVHGVKGEIVVMPYTTYPENFAIYPELTLTDKTGQRKGPFTLLGSKRKDRSAILRLEGLNDRDAAETCRGREVLAAPEYLPELPDGKFYLHQVVDASVVTSAGDEIGRVAGILTTGAHDILVVRGNGQREYLIPLGKEFIAGFEEASGVLTIDPPPGLLEIND